MNLTISLAQTQIHPGNPEENFDQIQQLVQEAAGRGSRLILLPELWSTGYTLAEAAQMSRSNQQILPRLAHLANKHAISIGGSMILEEAGQFYNSFTLHAPDSISPIHYEKIHLFRLMDEDRWLSAGNRLTQFSAPWGETGLAVCYDLRFPEMFRHYALNGVRLVLISAEWPLQRIGHWQTLLQARAIENQCFVAAANCVGVCAGETFGGCSAVISPWGDVVGEGSSDQPELLTVRIDMDEVATVRQRIPIFDDRRPDLYG